MSAKLTLLVCALILAAGAGVTALIFMTEPTAERSGATKETAMLVDVVEARRGTHRPTIVAMGTVEPAQDVVLSPQVAGRIVSRSPGFVPGGFVDRGETLLQIDPADFRNVLEQRRSDLRRAEADLALEQGRRTVAQRGYQLLDEELAVENESLVLREPQLDTARAMVASARAAVAQAELELERTMISAPFDAHILSRDANVGSQVAPGDRLGRLVGLDEYWVVATVPLSKLRWIAFPDDPGERGAEVRIHNAAAWPEGTHRTGYVDRMIGSLDERTRMARVLVSVPDPLARRPGAPDRPAMMIDAFVEARIEARAIAGVIRLDRGWVRQDDTVWVMEGRELSIRDVEIVFRDAQHAYVAGGLEANDRVVTTNLTTVVEGARLRLAGSDAAPGDGDADGGAE